jgi:multiple antibiotic resistance protein
MRGSFFELRVMDSPAIRDLPASQIFTFFFLMLGPLKSIGPFAVLTAKAEPPLMRRLAVAGTAIATVAVIAGAFVGRGLLDKWQVSLSALTLAAGVILTLVALKSILEAYSSAPPHPGPERLSMRLAANPIAFPILITPYGLAAAVLFLSLQPDQTPIIIAMLVGIMLLNLVFLIFSRPLLRYLGTTLAIIGTLLSVFQVALGIQIIYYAIKMARTYFA